MLAILIDREQERESASVLAMSIRQYFKPRDSLPDPRYNVKTFLVKFFVAWLFLQKNFNAKYFHTKYF